MFCQEDASNQWPKSLYETLLGSCSLMGLWVRKSQNHKRKWPSFPPFIKGASINGLHCTHFKHSGLDQSQWILYPQTQAPSNSATQSSLGPSLWATSRHNEAFVEQCPFTQCGIVSCHSPQSHSSHNPLTRKWPGDKRLEQVSFCHRFIEKLRWQHKLILVS